MLFHPLRARALTLLEMGLLIGGPEHGKPAGRETKDLPSARMWLEFFPKAQVVGLDVSDFAWFRHPRFRFVHCDMDQRESLAAAAAAIGPLDVVIDDASHASHHQQFGFLEMFPRLASGGLYIIEDLRWQPAVYEREGFTKTAALFRGFSERRGFQHSDPGLREEFDRLAPAISGCFLFQAGWDKGRRDQVAVIHKR